MVIVRVTYHMKPGMRDAFAARLIEDGVMDATRSEEGNVEYAFSLSIADPDVMYLNELWENQDVLKAHYGQPMFKHLREMQQEYVEQSVLEVFDGECRK